MKNTSILVVSILLLAALSLGVAQEAFALDDAKWRTKKDEEYPDARNERTPKRKTTENDKKPKLTPPRKMSAQEIRDRKAYMEEEKELRAQNKGGKVFKPKNPVKPGGFVIAGPENIPAPPTQPKPAVAKSPVVKADNPILYFAPAFRVVDEGEEFEIELRMENPTDQAFDRFGATISYDPQVLTILPVEQQGAKQAVKNATSGLVQPGVKYDLLVNRVAPDKGLVFYHIHFPEGEGRRFKGELGKIRFRASAPGNSSSLRFVHSEPGVSLPELQDDESAMTYLTYGGKDVLGEPTVPGDGTLSADVRVRLPEIRKPVTDLAAISGVEESLAGNPMGLSILPSKLTLRAGEDFVLRLRLDNSSNVAYDYVCVLIQFDPRYVSIADADRDNWIQSDTNIYDAPFHSAFPFDFARANKVFATKQGAFIDYRHGGLRGRLNSSGYFAEIHGRALKPSPATRLVFRFQKPGLEPTTGVFLKQRDLLGDPANPSDGVSGTELQILPGGGGRKVSVR